MSSYLKTTKNPETGKFEIAAWLDDYFGRHRYGVKLSNGSVYSAENNNLETKEGHLPEVTHEQFLDILNIPVTKEIK